MRSPNHPLVRAVTQDPNSLSRFWALVDRATSADECWTWRGRHGDRHPVFRVKYHTVSAARVAWFAATGEFPLGGRIRHTCENIACVRPEHLIWELGLMSERVLQTNSNHYVEAIGVTTAARRYVDAEETRQAS